MFLEICKLTRGEILKNNSLFRNQSKKKRENQEKEKTAKKVKKRRLPLFLIVTVILFQILKIRNCYFIHIQKRKKKLKMFENAQKMNLFSIICKIMIKNRSKKCLPNRALLWPKMVSFYEFHPVIMQCIRNLALIYSECAIPKLDLASLQSN